MIMCIIVRRTSRLDTATNVFTTETSANGHSRQQQLTAEDSGCLLETLNDRDTHMDAAMRTLSTATRNGTKRKPHVDMTALVATVAETLVAPYKRAAKAGCIFHADDCKIGGSLI